MFFNSSYLQAHLGSGLNRKLVDLSGALFYYDDSSVVDPKVGGMKKRAEFLKNSKEVELLYPLLCDFFQTTRFIPTNVSITLRLVLNTDDFIFLLEEPKDTASKLTTCPYKIQVTSAVLNIKRHALVDSLSDSLNTQLKSKTCFLPCKSHSIKFFNIQSGLYYSVNESIVSGMLPEKMVICFQKTSALIGDMYSNPFHFKEHGVQSVTIVTESEIGVETQTLELDMANNVYLDAWRSLANLVPSLDVSNDIDRSKYKDNVFFAFNILPSTLAATSNIKRMGSVKCSVKFKTASTYPLTMISFSIYDTLYQMNENEELILVQ